MKEYAAQARIGRRQLLAIILPALKAADVIEFRLEGDELVHVEEYVGLTGRLIEQSVRVLEQLGPSDHERALLHSVEVASWAPLTQAQHLEQLGRRGFGDDMSAAGLQHALAAGVNQRVASPELRENVVFNPYVWGSGQVPIAGFLRSLPPAEREALLGICEQASDRPGLALPTLTGGSPATVNSARKVGLLQASTVKSTGGFGASQTYVFSPLLESEDDKLLTTEALHQRKLFVAHILFGKEMAQTGRGRVQNPVVLVNALLNRGSVGPASNIATDYHLLEAQGIVRVEQTSGGRAYLNLVKREIAEGGLAWLRRTTDDDNSGTPELKLLRSPGGFVTPEQDRRSLGDQGEADEIARSAVLRLREEAARAARQETPF